MKILISNWVYNWGSTGYILRDLRNELEKQGHEVVTVCGVNLGERDDRVHCVSKRIERIIYTRWLHLGGSKFDGSTLATTRFIKIIKRENPDIVHLHLMHCNCLNFFMLLKYLSKNHIKTVITHHAEIYYTGSCGYAFECNKWINEQCCGCEIPKEVTGCKLFANPHRNWKRMADVFTAFDTRYLYYTTVSPWLKERFELSPLSKNYRCDVVMNGIETEVYRKRAYTETLEKKGLSQYSYVLYVSARFDPTNKDDIKGGYYIHEIAKRMPDEKFVVVATENNNCDCLPSNILLWGKASNQEELAELYSNAKITLLTSKKETFSMICAESFCCGTQVVGFLAGGPESISLSDYSKFVEYQDTDALSLAIKELSLKDYDRDNLSNMAQKKYSRKAMTDRYVSVYNQLLSMK